MNENSPEQTTHAHEATANDRLKESFNSWFWGSVAAAAVVHFLFLFLWPALEAEDYGSLASEMEAIELPPEVEIPPPPEDIPRPAIPVIGDVELEDITIAETTIDALDIDDLPPPPSGQTDISAQPVFTPYDVKPEFDRARMQRLLEREWPQTLKDAGIGGQAVLHVFVTANGNVGNTKIMDSSGYPELDRAAEKVLRQTKFTPALSRDTKVPVWIQLPVTFRLEG
ncbi:MAG: energy transducer TonB [Longimicrobiaceae bacterium]